MNRKKIRLVTPEKLVGMKEPKECWHHGTCDRCLDRCVLVFHLGYNQQAKPYGASFRICRKCIGKVKREMFTKWETMTKKEALARIEKIFGKEKK